MVPCAAIPHGCERYFEGQNLIPATVLVYNSSSWKRSVSLRSCLFRALNVVGAPTCDFTSQICDTYCDTNWDTDPSIWRNLYKEINAGGMVRLLSIRTNCHKAKEFLSRDKANKPVTAGQ